MGNRYLKIFLMGMLFFPFFVYGEADSLRATDGRAKAVFYLYPFETLVNPEWVPYGHTRFNIGGTPGKIFKQEAHLDPSQENIIFSYKFAGEDYLLPMGMSVNDYMRKRQAVEFSNSLYVRNRKKKQSGLTSTGRGIELNVPIRIKSKTFRRVFGGDQVGFRVTGNITLEMAGEVDKYPGAQSSAYQQTSVFSPKFKETQQFQVEGRVGKKVTVSVQQNSEATFDFENTLKIKYKGDEDEIIQSIEAGNVGLSLPSTRYVSGGSSHQGLFGLKAKMQVGKLKLTTIASLEKGEKKKQTLTGGAKEQTYSVYDYEYVKNQFFFVDTFYIDYFENFNDNMSWVIDADRYETEQIVDLEVWVSETNTNTDVNPGIAAINPENYVGSDFDDVEPVPGEVEKKTFRQLKYLEDFDYDPLRGFFWLITPVEVNKVIGIAYRLKQEGRGRGTTMASELTDTSSVLILKLIKPGSLNPGYAHCWNLMMKNVYDVGSKIPSEGFDVKIRLYKTGGNEEVQPVSPAKHFTWLLGLDRLGEQGEPLEDADNKADINNGNIFLKKYGKIIFPSLTPFMPADNSEFQIDEQFYVDIYNTNDEQEKNKASTFEIVYTSSESRSSFSLGFNILEGSEEVRLNGRKLVKGIDYTIDYFSGELNLINPAAMAPDAKIEIEYESASIFQLNKKTLLGMHGTYEFDKDNFIGMAGMFLNKTSIDDKIRLGQEPTKDFIWDIHGQFTKESRWLTRMLDKLPILQTDRVSKFQFNAEMAQIRPNPNTRNNEDIGDNNGVAYIDDFEGSERSTTLGITPGTWTPASIPVDFRHPIYGSEIINPFDYYQMQKYDTSRVHLNWYWQQTSVQNIWPNREVSQRSGTSSLTNILRLRWINLHGVPADKNWWGLMRSTRHFPNQQNTKFIELWVRGYEGTLHIDIGKISEDWWIRGVTQDGVPSLGNLNTEDTNNNGFLEEDEDTGIDGVKGNDNNHIPGDAWNDDYKAYNVSDTAYFNVNGTEGNFGISEERFPDSEDLDREGLDLFNEYFEYIVSLDSNDTESQKYFVGETEAGWRQIRIPIKDYAFKVGNPDTNFQEIYFARMWMNNLKEDNSFHYLDIAAFDFIGYEWETLGIAASDTSDYEKNDSLFQVTVYNTEENAVQLEEEGAPERYYSPPNVYGNYDRINEVHSKEQSLVLRAIRLEPGERGAAEKYLQRGQKYDLSQYKKIKFFIHGDWKLEEDDTTLIFKMQMGHSLSDYYEIVLPVRSGWEEIEVNLNDLTQVKQEQYLVPDSIDGKPVYKKLIPGFKDRYYMAVGYPSVNNITYLRYVLKNGSPLMSDNVYENMEVWIDELRATDVRKEPGTALRMETNIELADIVKYSGRIESKDANFHSLGQSISSSAMNTENLSHTLNLSPHKFLPAKLNVNIPVSIRYNLSKSIPKYYMKTDRLTGYEYSSILDRLNALLGKKDLNPELNKEMKFSESFAYSVNFSRTKGPKDPWYLKYTINNLKMGFNYNNAVRHDFNIAHAETENKKFDIKYSFPFPRDKYVEPLKWIKKIPFLKRFAEEKFYYMPQSFSTGLTVKNDYKYSRTRVGDLPTETDKISTNRSYAGAYKLTDQISMNLSRNYMGDASLYGNFNDFVNRMVAEAYFGTTTRISQNFSFNYKPKRWFTFFTPGYNFTSAYNYTYQINNNARNLNMNRNYGINATLKMDKLMEAIYNPIKKGQNNRKSRRSRASRRSGEGENDNVTVKDKRKVNKKGNKADKSKIPNPLILTWKALHAWKDIKFDYKVTDNITKQNVDDHPQWQFVFGFDKTPLVGSDTTYSKIALPRMWKHTEKFNSSVQFNPLSSLSVRLNYTTSSNRNESMDVVTGSAQYNYLIVGNDPQKNVELLKLIPNWSVRFTNLQKYFGLSKYFNSLSLEHARNGQYSKKYKLLDNVESPEGETFTKQYQPFIKIDGKLKWNINISVNTNFAESYSYSASGNASKQENSSYNFNMSYRHSGGLVIPLPFLENKKIKNDVSFNFQVQASTNKSYTRRATDNITDNTKFVEMDVTNNLSIGPGLTYRISKTINGEVYSIYRHQKSKRTEHSHFEMGIRVNIEIR